MKEKIRVLGIDDSYFVPHRPGRVDIVGVVTRAPSYIEGILIRKIEVDGLDCTEKVIDMLTTKYGRQIKAVLAQGMTFGGFNILDIDRVYNTSGIPVVAVSRKLPSMEDIKSALEKHFSDWELRWKLLSAHQIHKIRNGRYDVYVQFVGLNEKEVKKLLELFTVRGAIPEPLRIAHLIASALHFGESRGKP